MCRMLWSYAHLSPCLKQQQQQQQQQQQPPHHTTPAHPTVLSCFSPLGLKASAYLLNSIQKLASWLEQVRETLFVRLLKA